MTCLRPIPRGFPVLAAALAVPLLGLGAPAATAVAQLRPYAPKAPVPEDLGRDPLLRMEAISVARADIPSRAEVEAPPYPGGVVVRTIPERQRSVVGGSEYETLPVVVLVTTDTPGQVIDFYRRHLQDWSFGEFLDSAFFWLGEEFDPLGKSGKTTPSVQIREAARLRLVPEARTEIHVRYWPGGGFNRRRGSP